MQGSAVFAGLFFFVQISAFAAIDIRATGGFDQQALTADYTLTITDCHLIDKVEITAGSYHEIKAAEYESDRNTCDYIFSARGSGYLQPGVNLTSITGAVTAHSELFEPETIAPIISFGSVSINAASSQQYLVMTVTAQDNVDLRYVSFSLTGLKASDLRAAGGVIEAASAKAFARTGTAVRVNPLSDEHSEFVVSLPIKSQLTADQIAHDGVVLYDVVAVDASGNSSSISGLAFTGTDVNEEILGIDVFPSSVIISNAIEVIALVPSVNYQFRGWTPKPGANTGFTYTSSDTSYVQVSQDGLVRPVRNTDAANVSISVCYPGQTPFQIPVKVDFTKTLSHLEFEGVTGNILVPNLNSWYHLPRVLGVFTDGDKKSIDASVPLQFSINSAYQSILQAKSSGDLLAKAVISQAAPAVLTISLPNNLISTNFNVISQDALPVIKFTPPTRAVIGENLVLKVDASDDVGIRDVKYYLDGAQLATKQTSPYEIVLPIAESLLDRTLQIRVEATDTVGHVVTTDVYPVTVVNARTQIFSKYSWESPGNLQTVIEGTAVRLQFSRNVGEDILDYSPELSSVDFFMDGKKVGSSYAPIPEIRKRIKDNKEIDEIFEVWKLDVSVPVISTDESSVSIGAVLHGRDPKITAQQESILIRILKNQKPQISFIKPTLGQTAAVGENLAIQLLFSDDTLSSGVKLGLYVDEALVQSASYGTNVDSLKNADNGRQNFVVPIPKESLGKELKLYATIIDVHGLQGRSATLTIPVKADDPPQVSIAHPQTGQEFTFGTPVDFRVNAVDDIQIRQVDFYVNLLKKVRETPEWHDFLEKGAFDQTTLNGDAYAKWVEKEEKRHLTLMTEAGFLAKK